jgi:hypothetical protein
MSFIRYNNNPDHIDVGDCVIRAISTALELDWYEVHDDLCSLSRDMSDMPSSNRVWKKYLRDWGLKEYTVETECPYCLTVRDFCKLHSNGRYIVSTCDYATANQIIVVGSHLIPIIMGNYIDSWDSGSDIPLSYFV